MFGWRSRSPKHGKSCEGWGFVPSVSWGRISIDPRRAFAAGASTVGLVAGRCFRQAEYLQGNFDLAQPYKVVANLPYAIASVWLDRVLELPRLPKTLVLLVQKEAADRWFSEVGCKSFGAIGIYLQAMYRLEQKCGVSKRCFYPQPKVDSILLHIQKRADGYLFPKEFKQFIRTLFTHRRQQISRTCKETHAPFVDDFLNFLEKQKLPKTVRAEAVPLELWIEFSKGYFSEHSEKTEFHHDVRS